MRRFALVLVSLLVTGVLGLGGCKSKGAGGGGGTAGGGSGGASGATLDRAYALQFYQAAAKAFRENKASGEKAATAALAFVRSHRAKHDQLKAYFKGLTMSDYLAMSKKGDDLGQAMMGFAFALGSVKDMATSYKTKAWQDFTAREQPRPGRFKN